MRKPKRSEAPSDDRRAVFRACAMLLCVFTVWVFLYMPLARHAPLPLPDHLTWMTSQRDLTRYILPDNDTDVLQPRDACGAPFVAVVVCSAVANFEAREAIRETWGSDVKVLKGLRVYFLVGISSNASLNSALVQESLTYGDLIQQDFLDTYNNLTLKSTMLLKWVNGHCPQARYVMKTDDDMFIHVPNLMRLLKSKGKKGLLIGCLIKGAVPVKDWTSKWYVPDAVFPDRVYPNYLSGTGYVLSQDTLPVLYQTALETPFFYLEDVFVTGICASRAGLKPRNHEGFKFYKRKNDSCVFRSLVTAHKMTPKELRQVWAQRDSKVKCRANTKKS